MSHASTESLATSTKMCYLSAFGSRTPTEGVALPARTRNPIRPRLLSCVPPHRGLRGGHIFRTMRPALSEPRCAPCLSVLRAPLFQDPNSEHRAPLSRPGESSQRGIHPELVPEYREGGPSNDVLPTTSMAQLSHLLSWNMDPIPEVFSCSS